MRDGQREKARLESENQKRQEMLQMQKTVHSQQMVEERETRNQNEEAECCCQEENIRGEKRNQRCSRWRKEKIIWNISRPMYRAEPPSRILIYPDMHIFVA